MATLVEVSKPEYNLGRPMEIDRSSDNIVYRSYKPDVPITVLSSDSAPMNVVWSIRDLNEHFLLQDSFIQVKGTFCKNAGLGSALVATDKPALENAYTSMFSQSRLRLNGQLVEDNSTLSHINAFVRQLTNLSPDYVLSSGQNTGFILDQNTGAAQDVDYTYVAGPPISVGRNLDYNDGFLQRRIQAGANLLGASATGVVQRSFVVRLSDLLSIANCRKVMKGVSLRLELTTRTQAEMMFSSDNGTKFIIEDLELVVAIHNPSLDQLAELESEFASGNEISYSYPKYTTYESNMETALSTGSYRSFTFNTSSQKPIGCFIFCQRDIAGGVDQRQFNSMVFDNCNLSNVRCKVNGVQYPYNEYEVAFRNGGSNNRVYARAYEEFLRFLNKNQDVSAPALITPDQWANLYCMFWIPFHNLRPSASYQITAEIKNATGALLDVNIPGGANTRHLTNTKMYMTLLTVGEVVISGDRSGVVVRSN
jgi:hypothetical protein